MPEMSVSHMEIQGSSIMSLERATLSGAKIQSLTAANNKLQSVSEKSFRYVQVIFAMCKLCTTAGLFTIPYTF